MLDAIYNSKILEYAGNIARIGHLDNPDAVAKKHSKLCGSTVQVEINAALKNGELVVTDFAHDVKACALGQASSSIMANHIIGTNSNQLKDLYNIMNVMLKENGAPPEGQFDEFKYLEPVRDYKARHASTLLTFEAVVDCLHQIENASDV